MGEFLKIRKEIARLNATLEKTAFSEREISRARRNIEAVGERLDKRDYRIASYSDNKFNVPERIRDFFY